jgi:ParB-like chromosome segregation protein Spo0J
MSEEEIREQIERFVLGADLETTVNRINQCKRILHELSPFSSEPVDCVLWVKNSDVTANDYNPNKVAPPEMELLEVSILHDGYTQPIVTWQTGHNHEVIDGFHRSRVGKESSVVGKRVHGYLPIVEIRGQQTGKNDRIASTIRHNRARGKHQIDAMSEIVLELKNRNWTNARIARELGMDEDEILRLCQITGLEHLFTDADFSMAWEASDSIHAFVELTDDLAADELDVRTANTSDPLRRFHTFDKWECHKAGFYNSTVEGKSREELVDNFADFFRHPTAFRDAVNRVVVDWPNSCEHYLTNSAMNRIAWLGQAACCYAKGIPSTFCSGWSLLTDDQQKRANEIALEALNQWMFFNGRPTVDMETAISVNRQVEIY